MSQLWSPKPASPPPEGSVSPPPLESPPFDSIRQPNPGRRIAQIVKLRPECVAKYKACHAAVWPEVLKQIKACNIRDCKSARAAYASRRVPPANHPLRLRCR